jgi:HAMP domain-containing protein
MVLFLIPLLVVFLILIGISAFFRTAALVRESSQSGMKIVTESVLTSLDNWSENRDLWLQRAHNQEFKTNVVNYLNNPDTQTRQTLLETLNTMEFYQGKIFFSDFAVLRINGTTPSVLIATDSDWETTAPPSFISLPQDAPFSWLLFNDPVITPGGLAYISSLPVNINGDEKADIIILGVATDEAISSLLEELQLSADRVLPGSLRSSNLYLAFRPDILIPVRITGETPETLTGSTHPSFSSPRTGTFETTYQNEQGSILSSSSWDSDGNFGIILDTPRSAELGTLFGLGVFLAALIFIGALLSSIAVILATNQLLQPLGELVDHAERISRGIWDQRIDDSGTDEFGMLARTFNHMVGRLSTLYQSLEAKVEDRTRQIRTASEVARTATSSPSLDDLLQRAVNLIAERFSYSSVSIFLLNPDNSTAVLRKSSSELGQALIARDYTVPVNADSIIGWVASATQLHLSRSIRSDPLHLPDQLLPDTIAEAAFPLQFGGRVLGILDIQSSAEGAFPPESLEILATLADELSAAIHNASLAQASATIAARARLITEITSRLSGVLEIHQVLETTAEILHNSLGRPEVLVKMVPAGVANEEPDLLDAYDPSAETLQTPFPNEDLVSGSEPGSPPGDAR